MNKWQLNEQTIEAAEAKNKGCSSTALRMRYEDTEGKDSLTRHKFLLPNDNAKSKNDRKSEIVKSVKTDAKTEKAKISAIPRAKPEKQHIPDFPWKWDWPDLQSSPVERIKRGKDSTKMSHTEANHMTQGSDKEVEELNAQINWIYEDSSESDTELNKSRQHQENDEPNTNKKGPFDEKFRDHLMKELLKQGKEMNWFVAGAKKALDNIEKGQHATEPGMRSAIRVSQELNQFIVKSMRPYYQEKKREIRTRKKPE